MYLRKSFVKIICNKLKDIYDLIYIRDVQEFDDHAFITVYYNYSFDYVLITLFNDIRMRKSTEIDDVIIDFNDPNYWDKIKKHILNKAPTQRQSDFKNNIWTGLP